MKTLQKKCMHDEITQSWNSVFSSVLKNLKTFNPRKTGRMNVHDKCVWETAGQYLPASRQALFDQFKDNTISGHIEVWRFCHLICFHHLLHFPFHRSFLLLSWLETMNEISSFTPHHWTRASSWIPFLHGLCDSHQKKDELFRRFKDWDPWSAFAPFMNITPPFLFLWSDLFEVC